MHVKHQHATLPIDLCRAAFERLHFLAAIREQAQQREPKCGLSRMAGWRADEKMCLRHFWKEQASEAAGWVEWAEQLAQLHAAPWPVVIVGNEIGWSPVPEHPVLRRFRDLAGSLAQATAATADEAWLLVAGCPVRLK